MKIWRDDGDTDFTASSPAHSIYVHNSLGQGPAGSSVSTTSSRNLATSDGISLASSFRALPDIDDISTGSATLII